MRDLVASGELERTRAQEWIEDLVKRSREASETSRREHQLPRWTVNSADRGLKNLDLDDLAQRVAGDHRARRHGRTQRDHAEGVVQGRRRRNRDHCRDARSSPNGAGSEPKPASAKASGKKKDGSDKTSAKAGKKTESKKDGPKKSEHKKADSKKTESDTIPSAPGQSAQGHEHTAEDRTGPLDHGVTT